MTEQTTPQSTLHPGRTRARLLLAGAVALALIAGAIAAALAFTRSEPGTPGAPTATLRTAYEACGASVVGIELRDDGHTLMVDTLGQAQTYGAAEIEDAGCVSAHLKMPDSITAQMDATRALDGMQTATWDDFTVKWTYHPDDGLDLIITEN